MERVLTIACIAFLVLFSVASPSAVFEVDLLKYEALPNKCCDGYKHVPFGPLKCNECDPYFKICLKQPQSGASQCVTTSRENNVHMQDLTRGNIQPNHLSMTLDRWQALMIVDVDIKDFDSTTEDDDIDHLVYTYRGLPQTAATAVTINGTKVRLTIGVKVSCSTNFYGPDCNTYCVGDSRFYCTPSGTKRCKPGFNCDQTTPGNDKLISQISTANPSPRVTTEASDQQQFTDGSKTTTVNENKDIPAFTTETSQSSSQSAPGATADNSVNNDHKKNDNVGETNGSEIVKETPPKQQYTKAGTAAAVAYTRVDQPTVPTIDIETWTNSPKEPSESPHMYTTDVDMAGMTTALQVDGDNYTTNSSTGEETTKHTTTETYKSTAKIDVPEPLELYSCNMLVQGHQAGIHTQVVTVVYNALASHPIFMPNSLLGVNAISSTFEYTDSGLEITDVSYVVNFDGQVIRTESVMHVLKQPPVARLLDEQLTARNLHQYRPQHLAARAAPRSSMQWVKSHLPFVLVMGCVVLILIAVPVAVYCRKSHNQRSVASKKSSKLSKKNLASQQSQNYDLAYSIENPLYDFDTGVHKALP